MSPIEVRDEVVAETLNIVEVSLIAGGEGKSCGRSSEGIDRPDTQWREVPGVPGRDDGPP
jgi:hypothetical protein